MLEQRVRSVSEALARGMNRRTFLRRAGSAVTSGVAALALGSLISTRPARAARTEGSLVPGVPSCSPPGPYCNTGGGILSGCHGGHCYEHLYNGQILTCQVYYQYYQVGCWTSGDGWTCCDCACGSPVVTHCGCAQLHTTPAALAE
jgi:hypothetical protein